jgi:PTS system galactitol-specific IIA component
MEAAILENVNIVKLNRTTRDEVLKDLSEIAITAGFAKQGYDQAIIERENQYPTGLHIPEVEVAIPHADVEWAIKPSLTIAILDHPVTFGSMDGSGGDVMAKLVFMLTIEEPRDHIDFLRSFSGGIGQPDILKDFVNSADPGPMFEKIRNNLPVRQVIHK